MIHATFSSNINEYSATIKKLILESGKNASEIIRQEARLFVRDCMKLTPPRKKAALSQSWSDQRKQGEDAIRRDFERVFKPVSEMAIAKENTRVGVAIRKYMREGNLGAINKIIHDFGGNAEVLAEVNEAIHKGLRGPRGGLKGRPRFVVSVNSIKRLLAEKIKHVFKAKAGWLRAAQGLGVKGIPGWVTRHKGQPGLFEDRLGNFRSPSVTVGNLVDYIQAAGREVRVMEQAINTRTVALKKRIELMMNALHRKYSAK